MIGSFMPRHNSRSSRPGSRALDLAPDRISSECQRIAPDPRRSSPEVHPQPRAARARAPCDAGRVGHRECLLRGASRWIARRACRASGDRRRIDVGRYWPPYRYLSISKSTDMLPFMARTRTTTASDPEIRLLAALADPTRLAIVRQLASDGETCACDFTEACEVGQPTVSHHLRVLREAGVVTSVRRGQWIFYWARSGCRRPSRSARARPRAEFAHPARRSRRATSHAPTGCRAIPFGPWRLALRFEEVGRDQPAECPATRPSGHAVSIRANAPFRIERPSAAHRAASSSLRSGSWPTSTGASGSPERLDEPVGGSDVERLAEALVHARRELQVLPDDLGGLARAQPWAT